MTISDYIERVRAKLDEFSPFVEPTTFVAAGGDPSYNDVKPIVAYIERELPNAVKYCLSTLPSKLLSKDIVIDSLYFTISNEVGFAPSVTTCDLSNRRLIRAQVAGYWERDVTSFISTESPLYLLQQNKHTRGKVAKPVVVYSPETNGLELYSFPYPYAGSSTIDLWSVDTSKSADLVISNIEDFIIIRCAQLVLDILGNANGAAIMEKEYIRKVEAL